MVNSFIGASLFQKLNSFTKIFLLISLCSISICHAATKNDIGHNSKIINKETDIVTDIITTSWSSGEALPLFAFFEYMTPLYSEKHLNDETTNIMCDKKISICIDVKKNNTTLEKTTATTKNPNADKENISTNTEKQKSIFDIQENDMVFGDPNADVIFIEYSSPTCTHCAYFHKEIYPELRKQYVDTKKIAYVVRQFIANKQDLDAAVLGLCGGQDLFVKIREVLYKQQGSWAFNTNYRDILTNIGQLSGISGEQYADCLADDSIMSKLINDSRNVTQAPNFIGTPTFVIGGKLYNQAYTYKNLSGAIEKEIKNQQKTK